MKKIILATLILGISFTSIAETIYHSKDEMFMGDVKIRKTLSQGKRSVASGENSSALGFKANATNDNSFVWNGNDEQEDYGSHNTNGTFNINPIGELNGFYIGDKTLSDILGEINNGVSSIQINDITPLLKGDLILTNGQNIAITKIDNNKIKISVDGINIGVVSVNGKAGEVILKDGDNINITTNELTPSEIIISATNTITSVNDIIGTVSITNKNNNISVSTNALKPNEIQLDINEIDLNELHDVSLNNTENNQVLSYNSTSDKWTNRTITDNAGITSINGKTGPAIQLTADHGISIYTNNNTFALTNTGVTKINDQYTDNVVITNKDNNISVKNENNQVEIDIGDISIKELSDVKSDMSPTDGKALVYNNGKWTAGDVSNVQVTPVAQDPGIKVATITVNGSGTDIEIPKSNLAYDNDAQYITAADVGNGKLQVSINGGTTNEWFSANTANNHIIELNETDPTVNNSTITIQTNNQTVGSFTVNDNNDHTVNIDIPTVNNSTVTIKTNNQQVGTFTLNNSQPQEINFNIPTVNNSTISITTNSQPLDSFTLNANNSKTINIDIPKNVSDLVNDSGYNTNVTWTVDNNYNPSKWVKIGQITYDDVSTNVYAPQSGSVVSWNQIIDNGTQIATITIDDNPTPVYIPIIYEESTNTITINTNTLSISNNPVFTNLVEYVKDTNDNYTAITIGSRATNSNVGISSVTIGTNLIASGNYSVAEGDNTFYNFNPLLSWSEADNVAIDTSKTLISGRKFIFNDVLYTVTNYVHGTFGSLDSFKIYLDKNITLGGWAENFIDLIGEGSIGVGSHTEGKITSAFKDYSHAEGFNTLAKGNVSHSEGKGTLAIGDYSHAEGLGTIALGDYSHAEGNSTEANGKYSHAEGDDTIASGDYSHAEGNSTIASGDYSHAEGYNTTASGTNSITLGNHATAEHNFSYVWNGTNLLTIGNANNYKSHADGSYNINPIGGITNFWIGNDNLYTHITNSVGGKIEIPSITNSITIYTNSSFQDTYYLSNNPSIFLDTIDELALRRESPTTGVIYGTGLSGAQYSFLMGDDYIGEVWDEEEDEPIYRYIESQASGDYSIAIGLGAQASGTNSLAIGSSYTSYNPYTTEWEDQVLLASGDSSIAIGQACTASGDYSHAEGTWSAATNNYSYAWNGNYQNKLYYSHGDGTYSINPTNGINGFYIGDKPSDELFISYSTLKDLVDENFYYEAVNLNDSIAKVNEAWNIISNLVGTTDDRYPTEIRSRKSIKNLREIPVQPIGYWPGNIWINGRTVINYANDGSVGNLECSPGIVATNDVPSSNVVYSINNITFTEAGNNYNPTKDILVIEDIHGSGASATYTVGSNGEVTGVTVINSGSGYIKPSIYIKREVPNSEYTDAQFSATLKDPVLGGTSFMMPVVESGSSGSTIGSIQSERYYDPLANNSAITVMAWVKKTYNKDPSQGFAYRIISDYSSRQSNGDGFELRLSGEEGNIEVVINGSTYKPTGSGSSVFPTNTPVSDWKHIAVTWTSNIVSTRRVHIYINGSELGTGSAMGQTQINANNVPFTIGNNASSQEIVTSFPGIIDDVMIFDKALSLSEIREWMNYNDNFEQTPSEISEPIPLGIMDPKTDLYTAEQLDSIFGINNFQEQITEIKNSIKGVEYSITTTDYSELPSGMVIDLSKGNQQAFTAKTPSGSANLSLPNSNVEKYGKITIYLIQKDNFHYGFDTNNLLSVPNPQPWNVNTSSVWKVEFESVIGRTKWKYISSEEFIADSVSE